jgi:thiosulfate reductase cytochrome b subunit
MVNGLIFVILLFATGQWVRIIPTTWEVFPNAIAAMVQYASLDWPTENGWANYNSLQQLFYGVTVFVAAPIAAITGYRMSHFWPDQNKKLSKAFPMEIARALHFPVMLYFVFFIIIHVTLVFATGALRNLNHMYAGNDGNGWAGAIIFSISMVAIVAASVAAKPVILRSIAALFGNVSR